MLKDDRLTRVLYVNVSKRTFSIRDREDLFSRYIGGTGVATQLLHEECPEHCDPLGSDNPIIFAVGPLTGLYPLASKTVALFKSPLTGNLGESHCGGRSAVALRMAGYGALVITGASDIPVYISIDGQKVHFRDASSIWGMQSFSSGRIIRENETGAGLRTIMRIGAGGEQLVRYACLTTESYRHFGRLGLGAVFGSKKLKAVVISGKSSLPVADMKFYRKSYRDIFKTAVESPVMKKYHDLGTAENIKPLNTFGGLPTRNLKEARFDGAPGISGETLAEHYLGRRLACSHCPVGCIHIAALRELYDDEEYFYKTSMISYDYEPIYALGSMLGIGQADHYLKLMDRIEAFGIDAMSTGVALAWATEAMERGLITETETKGIRLTWGDHTAYMEAAGYIVSQPNEFYRTLARGVEDAAYRYGGEDFALTFGGNEMPGYHTGPAAHVGTLLGARHSHLDNGGYGIDQKLLAKKKVTPEELTTAILDEEYWRQILSSLVVCFFARGIYLPELVPQLLTVTGFEFTPDDLTRIGQEIHREKYRFKYREGFSLDTLRIPGRIFETPSPIPCMSRDYVEEAIACAKEMLSL